MDSKRHILIGNPNVGKSTLFNSLTKSNVAVGNFSGVTVDVTHSKLKNTDDVLIDLPGCYSMVPNSNDEGIVMKFLLEEKYMSVVNVIDPSALKRNLNLTFQILEARVPMMVIANMADELERRKIKLDVNKLSKLLNVTIESASSKNKQNKKEIIESIASPKSAEKFKISYDAIIEKAVDELGPLLPKTRFKRRFMALQMLEDNSVINDYVMQVALPENHDQISKIIEKTTKTIQEKYDNTWKARDLILQGRNKLANKIVDECLTVEKDSVLKREFDTKLDSILTSKYLGPIIFLLAMIGIYFLSFDLFGSNISDLIDTGVSNVLENHISVFMNTIGIIPGEVMHTIFIDGLLTGVGSVLVFLPQIIILFFFLGLLQATGYLSRVAVAFDKFFHRLNLSGKSIIPMITGVGCAVPAIMATRTIEDNRKRLSTILVTPFVPCSAMIPVFALMTNAFFPDYGFIIFLIMQILAIIVIVVVSKLLSLTIFAQRPQTDDFIVEMPPYRLPDFGHVFKNMFTKTKGFVVNAGVFIAIGATVISILSTIGPSGIIGEGESGSFLEKIGIFIAPIFIPIGFGTWQASSSILSGFLAKEAVVASIAVIYGVASADENSEVLSSILQSEFTQAAALSFLTFNLLWIPCVSTLGVIKKEAGWKFTGITVGFSITVAFIVSGVMYLIGNIIW